MNSRMNDSSLPGSDNAPTPLARRRTDQQHGEVLKRLKGKLSFIADPEHQRYVARLSRLTPEERRHLDRKTLPEALEQNAKLAAYSLVFTIIFAITAVGAALGLAFIAIPEQSNRGIADRVAPYVLLIWLAAFIFWNFAKAYRRQRANADYFCKRLIELADEPPDDNDPARKFAANE